MKTMKTIMNNENDMDHFCFTRYLYTKVEVKQSLMLSLLDHNYDESLFWAYEMYFSGFENETFEYLYILYEDLYEVKNTGLKKYIKNVFNNWEQLKQDWLLGSIVMTLCYRNYSLENFVCKFFKVKCEQKPTYHNNRNFIINLKESDIEKYKTRICEPNKAYKLLSEVCRYPIRKNIVKLFETFIPSNVKELYWYHWLYYAAKSPVWQSRINQYNGKINHENLSVDFHDECEEKMAEFYSLWGYEPDEQPLEVQNNNLGVFDDTYMDNQMGIKEFCDTYGVNIIMKKIMKKKTKEIEVLENTFVPRNS
uniref:Uncharacterized protein n=1 Tax=viral metagenome TaxID=1070528 RepID=A0A6C0DM20_9ZZZZ